MEEEKYDVIRGADIYRGIRRDRLEGWILKGIIKQHEALVRQSGFPGWRKPEELEELKPYYEQREKETRRKKKEVKPFHVPRKLIKNILIVDDEEDLCWLLSNMLQSKGYNVSTANTLSDGIACLKENPDFVFLDLKLPDGDGMEILPIIKKTNSAILVTVISAYGSEERREEAKEKGVYSFIDKPFAEENILNTIKQIANGS